MPYPTFGMKTEVTTIIYHHPNEIQSYCTIQPVYCYYLNEFLLFTQEKAIPHYASTPPEY